MIFYERTVVVSYVHFELTEPFIVYKICSKQVTELFFKWMILNFVRKHVASESRNLRTCIGQPWFRRQIELCENNFLIFSGICIIINAQ